MDKRPRTKAPKNEQLKGELQGELAAYEKFGLYQRAVNSNTAYRYRGALLRYQNFLAGNSPSLAATNEYLASLRKNDFDPATLRVYRAALAGFHQWRGEELKFKVKVPDTTAKYVPWEVVQKMLALASGKPHDELILRLMANAGLRRDEVVKLKVNNIEGTYLRFRGKGDKQRSVPMTEELQKLTTTFSEDKPGDSSIINLGEKGVYLLVKRYGASAGMPEITPHDLRRAFATHLLNKTGNIRIVQEILGHSNVETTQSYTAVTLNNMEEAIKHLDDTTPMPTESKQVTKLIKPVLKAVLHLKTSPRARNPKNPGAEALCCQNINIDIEASEIEIQSIEVTNSDPDVGYNLSLFVEEAPDELSEWGNQAIWTSGIVKSRFKTFKFSEGLNYKDISKTKLLHGGLGIGYRPMRCDLPFDENSPEMRAYYTKPLELDICVRYHILD
jgi:site-specific recombinase XerD